MSNRKFYVFASYYPENNQPQGLLYSEYLLDRYGCGSPYKHTTHGKAEQYTRRAKARKVLADLRRLWDGFVQTKTQYRIINRPIVAGVL